jgi:hypothetical protein
MNHFEFVVNGQSEGFIKGSIYFISRASPETFPAWPKISQLHDVDVSPLLHNIRFSVLPN